ncbi:cupredoxin domain-containing protein [Pseudarthrobacter sp. NPDC080039]|uniref:cupredoxin domain-containing protein n=1 Tax=unclassified Pseudarthrobacter TaxID=2647000 RepID=UPI00344C607C
MRTSRTRQRITLAVLAAATVIGASACGTSGQTTNSPGAPSGTASSTPSMDHSMGASSTGPSMPSSMGVSSGPAAMAEATIHIKSFAYAGPDSVPAGAAVTVMNMDSQAHTVTADDGSFDAVVKAGTSTTFIAPAKPGTYSYHCTYHSNMHGSLTVK